MKLILDGKSLAVGLFAGVAIAAGIGAVQPEEPEIGRYQISAAATNARIQGYVIDTATGKVWQQFLNSEFDDTKLGNEKP